MSQVITKFPTTTTTIVAGWTNPTNAYAEDGVNTYASHSADVKPEQKYGGWNFTTNDIPEGSTITKVELGAKHYETDPTGYYQYTTLKYVNSGGSYAVYTTPRRTASTWDWWDITTFEPSGWDLTKLNNADCRIIAELISTSGGGCFIETEDEHPYFITGDFKNRLIKTAGELVVGDKILIWNEKTGFLFSPITKIEEYKLVQEDVVEIWSGTVNLKEVIGRDIEWKAHTTLTKSHPLEVYKQVGDKFAGPLKLKVEELHNRMMAGEQFWIGHLWLLWKVKMFPITLAALKTVSGKAYKIVTKDEGRILTKSLMRHEVEFLNSLGLTREKQAKLGPPWMAIQVKTTSYVDAIALRVTFTPPAAGQYYPHGDSLAQGVIYT
ncbi:MAG: hypothetical protein QXL91_02010 [Candidatus Bathyarchaeia archaeon]